MHFFSFDILSSATGIANLLSKTGFILISLPTFQIISCPPVYLS